MWLGWIALVEGGTCGAANCGFAAFDGGGGGGAGFLGLGVGGLVSVAEEAKGDLGGVEELGGFGEGEDLIEETVGDAGDEGVDGVRGEDGHGAAPGAVDAGEGFRAEVVAGVFTGVGLVEGVKTALDGGFGGRHDVSLFLGELASLRDVAS